MTKKNFFSKFTIYFTSEMFHGSEWFSGEKWPNLRLTMMVCYLCFGEGTYVLGCTLCERVGTRYCPVMRASGC